MTHFLTVQGVNCLSCVDGAAGTPSQQRVSRRNSLNEGWICNQKLQSWLERNVNIQIEITWLTEQKWHSVQPELNSHSWVVRFGLYFCSFWKCEHQKNECGWSPNSIRFSNDTRNSGFWSIFKFLWYKECCTFLDALLRPSFAGLFSYVTRILFFLPLPGFMLIY